MIIEYDGEFGYELIGVVPYAHYLHSIGQLTQTISSKDTRCLYYFSDDHTEKYVERRDRGLSGFPFGDLHSGSINKVQWLPPKYTDHFNNKEFIFDKPLLIVSNKYAVEWNSSPVNYLNIETLAKIFDKKKDQFQLVYNRPRSKKIVVDAEQRELTFDDHNFIKNNYPEVILLDEYDSNYSFNLLQWKFFANCEVFISVQGGTSIISSYFGGKNHIYAVKGGEINCGAFDNWYHELSGCKISVYQNYEDLICGI